MTDSEMTLDVRCEELGERLELAVVAPGGDVAAEGVKVTTEFEF